jgi:hypothetical protein
MQDVAVKVVVTPLLIGGASLAGRRWGDQLGGWLVALPLTSGPVAFLLATDHGVDFAATAAVAMLAGTIPRWPSRSPTVGWPAGPGLRPWSAACWGSR